MFTLIVVGILVLIVAVIVYFEYKNEKEYQESRRKKNEDRKNIKPPYPPKEKIQKPLKEKNENKYVVEPRKVPSVQEIREAEEKEKRKAKRVQEKKVEVESIPEPEVEPEVIKKIDLPECKYPKFTYSRLLEMGLGEDEAMEFVKELIPQLKTQIPLIEEAMDKEDFHSMERLTHSIKGSSTTVGTGGVSDLLVEFNTYLKTGKEMAIAKVYFKNLMHYTDELEKQFA